MTTSSRPGDTSSADKKENSKKNKRLSEALRANLSRRKAAPRPAAGSGS